MEPKEMHCKLCGSVLRELENAYQCVDNGTHQFKEEDLLEQRAQLRELFGEEAWAQKEAEIAGLRRDLWEAAHKTEIDDARIAALCGELKALLPQDFLATFYETAICGTTEALSAFLGGIDMEKQAVYVPEVLSYITNHLVLVAYKERAEHLKLREGIPPLRIVSDDKSLFASPWRTSADSKKKDAPVSSRRKAVAYEAPSIELLDQNEATGAFDRAEIEEKAHTLETTLKELKVPASVEAIVRGPAVTRYELKMPPGVPIKRIEQFSADIAYNLESDGKIRIVTPIPGKKLVGVEVPNNETDLVRLREIIDTEEFYESPPLTVALGKDIEGNVICCNLGKMPHLLIAGATGSGKSVCLNAIIISLLYKASPDDVRLILIDPKRVEFNMYRGIPHLICEDIINETPQAINAFLWAREEMERRYKLFGKYCVRDLQSFNKSDAVKEGTEQKLPYIVVIVDELADLMLDSNHKELENNIMSIAQKARAAGIHLILATQRPTVDVITGTIKANLPSRIAFAVKSMVDSRTILDEGGAETLLGRGDMLYSGHGVNETLRVQGAYVSDKEVATVTEFVRNNNEAYFDDAFEEAINRRSEPEVSESEKDEQELDVLMPEVLKLAIEAGMVSTSVIQRRFSVGYARASRIIDQMEAHKFVGPLEGSKPREIYITREKYKELFGVDLDQSLFEDDDDFDDDNDDDDNDDDEIRGFEELSEIFFRHGLECYEKAKYTQAIQHWRRAANTGHADAQYCLGCLYYFGEKVAEDRDEATKWLRKAAAKGHAEAKKALKRLGLE